MTGQMRILASAACLLAGAAIPATADAARWRGKTEQGRLAAVRTGADGRVKHVTIGWRAPCRHGRYTDRVGFIRPLDFNVSGRFRDGSPPAIRERLKGGRHAIVKAHVRGHLGARGNWRGSFRVDVGVFDGTRRIDTCHLRGDSWHAKRISG